ncbi:MAG: 16S rRNA (uracil(1498)-N(3))-methyltransferase [Deltaproteobacteria bacterium]|nr:16S rRNA (uracil(1498)-N(3))-methyltransferase [Deltaproteobacteria bacterium]MBW2303798.1 16S rRNA (uracil(1498)-N(3))-methyltransferase [Deltaproteobacteria bacterium]
MRRFFVEEIKEEENGLCVIGGSEARHILRVLRMGPGDRFVLMDRKGSRYQVSIQSCSRREVTVLLERPIPSPATSPAEITLCQAILKSRSMDLLVQKATELGVHRIVPFASERTVIRLKGEQFASKSRRWKEIARNASKQSDRERPLEIGPLLGFEELLAYGRKRSDLKLMLWEGEQDQDLKAVLSRHPDSRSFFAIVGPEGGFTEQEAALARKSGIIAVSLGRRILRAETAGLVLAAILQYERGDLGSVANETNAMAHQGVLGPPARKGLDEEICP